MRRAASICGVRWLGVRAEHVLSSHFLRGGVDADDHHRLAQGAHALDHVRGAWRFVVPECDEHIADLGHLVVTAHAGGLPEALPFGLEELKGPVCSSPTLPERVGTPCPSREDLCDAVALRRQHLAQALIVGERP